MVVQEVLVEAVESLLLVNLAAQEQVGRVMQVVLLLLFLHSEAEVVAGQVL
jgi:hypothetical protein